MTERQERDLSFLEIKPDDDAHIRAMKSELQFVMAMEPGERKLFYQEQRVDEEERYLHWMIQSNKTDDEFIATATSKAKALMQNIQMYGHEDSWLEQAELWTEIAHGTKANKFTLKDIRKQRERIWEQKRKLKTMQQNAEQSQSSSNSKT